MCQTMTDYLSLSYGSTTFSSPFTIYHVDNYDTLQEKFSTKFNNFQIEKAKKKFLAFYVFIYY